MTYVGATPTTGDFKILDSITTSSATTFNLRQGGVAVYPQSANHCLVVLNGVLQTAGSSFNIVNDTIVFASSLSSSDVINQILVLGNVNDIGTPSDDTVSTAKIQANAVTAAKFNADVISGQTALSSEPADTDEFLVSDGGVIKRIDYSLIKGGGGLVLTGSSVSTSAASAITITNCFSATYQNYLITGSMIPSTDGSNLRFRLHDGSSALSGSSYAYTTHQMRIDSGGVAEATGGTHGASDVQLTSGNSNHISNSAATRMFVFSPAVADYRTTALIDTIGYTSSNDSDRNVQHMKYNVAHTALGITLYASSGDIDDFDIRVYGMVNS